MDCVDGRIYGSSGRHRLRLIRLGLLALIAVFMGYWYLRPMPPRPKGAPVFIVDGELQKTFDSLIESPSFYDVVDTLDAYPGSPQIRISYCGCEDGTAGRFKPRDRQICICKDLNSGDFDIQDTMAHEVRHVYQIVMKDHDCSWRDGFRPYDQKPCELDAEAFARQVVSELAVGNELSPSRSIPCRKDRTNSRCR